MRRKKENIAMQKVRANIRYREAPDLDGGNERTDCACIKE